LQIEVGDTCTVVGNGTAGERDGPGLAGAAGATLTEPSWLAANSNAATVLISEPSSHRIRKWASTSRRGDVSTLAGGSRAGFENGKGTAALVAPPRPLSFLKFCIHPAHRLWQFNSPHGVALSYEGDVAYVCDTKNNMIRKIWVQTGEVELLVGSGDTGSSSSPASRISPAPLQQKVRPHSGRRRRLVNAAGDNAQFWGPRGIALLTDNVNQVQRVPLGAAQHRKWAGAAQQRPTCGKCAHSESVPPRRRDNGRRVGKASFGEIGETKEVCAARFGGRSALSAGAVGR
jgi:hypothetical protein